MPCAPTVWFNYLNHKKQIQKQKPPNINIGRLLFKYYPGIEQLLREATLQLS